MALWTGRQEGKVEQGPDHGGDHTVGAGLGRQGNMTQLMDHTTRWTMEGWGRGGGKVLTYCKENMMPTSPLWPDAAG